MSAQEPILSIENVAKSFTMHLRGGAVLPVVRDVNFHVHSGECVVLGGPSGVGKSSLLKMIYGNYRTDQGEIRLKRGSTSVDIATADPRAILALRKSLLGYVSQFLRAIPRVPAIELVTAAACGVGMDRCSAEDHAQSLLARLDLPHRLWSLPPATFSGGEQQRVNIACGFAGGHPVLLLDEPTASLDAASRARVIELIAERRAAGTAILGIFHDEAVRSEIADRIVDVTAFGAA